MAAGGCRAQLGWVAGQGTHLRDAAHRTGGATVALSPHTLSGLLFAILLPHGCVSAVPLACAYYILLQYTAGGRSSRSLRAQGAQTYRKLLRYSQGVVFQFSGVGLVWKIDATGWMTFLTNFLVLFGLTSTITTYVAKLAWPTREMIKVRRPLIVRPSLAWLLSCPLFGA
jgi:hypothetical protein